METESDNEKILTDRQLKDFTRILLTGSLLIFSSKIYSLHAWIFLLFFCRLVIFFQN